MKKESALFVFVLLIVFSCSKKQVEKNNLESKTPEIEEKTTPKVPSKLVTEVKQNVSELIFTVQIAALQHDNENLLSIDGVKTYQEDSLTKYRIGNFKTYAAARAFRNQIKGVYKDAFVQALKDERPIAIIEALQN